MAMPNFQVVFDFLWFLWLLMVYCQVSPNIVSTILVSVVIPDAKVRSGRTVQCHIVYPSARSGLRIRIWHWLMSILRHLKNRSSISRNVYTEFYLADVWHIVKVTNQKHELVTRYSSRNMFTEWLIVSLLILAE